VCLSPYVILPFKILHYLSDFIDSLFCNVGFFFIPRNFAKYQYFEVYSEIQTFSNLAFTSTSRSY
jgi:hypothetical protein